jgi:hypothetical protein
MTTMMPDDDGDGDGDGDEQEEGASEGKWRAFRKLQKQLRWMIAMAMKERKEIRKGEIRKLQKKLRWMMAMAMAMAMATKERTGKQEASVPIAMAMEEARKQQRQGGRRAW